LVVLRLPFCWRALRLFSLQLGVKRIGVSRRGAKRRLAKDAKISTEHRGFFRQFLHNGAVLTKFSAYREESAEAPHKMQYPWLLRVETRYGVADIIGTPHARDVSRPDQACGSASQVFLCWAGRSPNGPRGFPRPRRGPGMVAEAFRPPDP